MEDRIDRFGICPNCKTSWDSGDIVEILSKLDCNSGKSEAEIKSLAANYGWFEHNKVHFSTLISHEIDGRNLLECPNIVCGHIFDRFTGQEYKSLLDVKENSPIIKPLDLRPTEEVQKLVNLQKDLKEEMFSKLGIPEEKHNVVHVTPQNREEIEQKLQNKILPEFPD